MPQATDSTIRVMIRLFAVLREQAGGVAEMPLVLPAGSSVADAVAMLGEHHPDMISSLSKSAAAVNLEPATRQTVLSDGDELALLPPVSGG